MYKNPSPFSSPEESHDTKHQKVNAIWKIFALVYVLAALCLCFYWEFTDSGLCIIIREWQVSLSGDKYYPTGDVLGALLALLLPLFVIKIAVQKITGVKIERGRIN
jgi:hypothetical protein